MMTGSTSVHVIYGLENGEAILITITIKEAAELKGCSERYLRKQALNGQIKASTEITKNGRKRYMIPLSELTEAEQLQYYRKHDIELPKELQKSKAKTTAVRSTNIEDYTAAERDEMAFWHEVVNQWNEYCIGKTSKVQATKEFVGLMKQKYPDIKISSDILYRRKRMEKEHGICGQVDKRGDHNKGRNSIPTVAWNTFLNFYLDQAHHPITKCYEYTEFIITEMQPDLVPLPSYRTFTRHVKSDVSEALKTLGRDGEKAFKDRCSPYIKRIYDNLESNDYWFGDNHTLDIDSIGKNGKIHRLHMSTFQDARSGIIVGFVLADGNTGQTTLLSMRKSIINFGCCKMVYLDNGREYMVTDIAGLGHRQKKSTADRQNPPTVLSRLNVGMINALVQNAQAKNIERAFRNVKDNFSRLFDTFVGGNVLEKPEKLKFVLKGKQGHIPTDEEVAQALEQYIYNVFNLAPYNGRVAKDKGKPKLQVFQENLKVKRVIPEEDLNLMLMRSSRVQTVGQRGVHFGDIDYWNYELLELQGKKVYYRYDPDNLSSIRVYDLDDRYLMTVPADSEAVCEFGTSKEKLSAAQKKVREYRKITAESLKAVRTMALGNKTALEIMLEQAEENKNAVSVAEGDYVIDIHRADEKEYPKKAVGAENEPSLRSIIANADENLISIETVIANLEKDET